MVLEALEQRLVFYPKFNIHVFLNLLQKTTRPLGYPPLKKAPTADYYLESIEDQINSAAKIRNINQLKSLMQSLYQVMVCFCYLQDTLDLELFNDAELLKLFFSAIDNRAYTTGEEQGAEKCLLLMLLKRTDLTLQLIAKYANKLCAVDMSEGIVSLTTCFVTKRKGELAGQLSPVSKHEPYLEIAALEASARNALKYISEFKTKKECQLVIGFYLLKIKDPMKLSGIESLCFLNEAMKIAQEKERDAASIRIVVDEETEGALRIKERIKREIGAYIALRKKETNWCIFFNTYSKNDKIRAAEKFLAILNGEEVSFSPIEEEALTSDYGSRLTTIYMHYATSIDSIEKRAPQLT